MGFDPKGRREGSVTWPVRLVFQFWAEMLLKKAQKVSNQRGALQGVRPQVGFYLSISFFSAYCFPTLFMVVFVEIKKERR